MSPPPSQWDWCLPTVTLNQDTKASFRDLVEAKAGARASQRPRSIRTRKAGSLGDGASMALAPRWSRSLPLCSVMETSSPFAVPLGTSIKKPCRASSGRKPRPTTLRADGVLVRAMSLLLHFRSIELLVGGFKPVQQRLTSWKSKRSNRHS